MQRDDLLLHGLTLAGLCLGDLPRAVTEREIGLIDEVSTRIFDLQWARFTKGPIRLLDRFQTAWEEVMRLDSQTVHKRFLGILRERVSSSDFGTAAAKLLGLAGEAAAFPSEVIPCLLGVLETYRDTWRYDDHLRHAASSALIRIGDPVAENADAIPTLLGIFSVANYKGRERIGDLLRSICEKADRFSGIVTRLLEAIEDFEQLGLRHLYAKYGAGSFLQEIPEKALRLLGSMGRASANNPNVMAALTRSSHSTHQHIAETASSALERIAAAIEIGRAHV